MKIKRSVFFLIPGFLMLIHSCKKDENINNAFIGYQYFPTNVGHRLIYDVEELYADSTGPTGIFYDSTWQIMEVIESTFNDNQGRPSQRLERYKRLTDSDPWIIYKVWTSAITTNPTQGIKEEDNITYVKLSFPVEDGKTWNGNIYNSLSSAQAQYQYKDENVAYSLNGLSFDSTLTVIQNLEDIAIYYDLQEEKYATGVGMFYKIQEHIEYIGATDNIKTRHKYVETLRSFSN